MRSIGAVVDRLDPSDAVRREPEWWSVACSTVVSSSISTFGQHTCSVASEGYCISCGKPFRADILGRCRILLRQNLSFVIIPLKIGSSIGVMALWLRDACQVRKGAAPHVLAVLNSFVLALFDFCGIANVKQQMRRLDAQPLQAVRLLVKSLGQN